MPPPPLPRPAAAPEVVPPCIGQGWEAPYPRPLLQVASPPAAMARPGDVALRPAEDFAVVPATPEMQAESALLSSNAAVGWLEGVSCRKVADEIVAALGVRPTDVKVVKHYPEQFFIRFMITQVEVPH
ncbi:zyxin-like [Triticum urartu]|uniref:zyxin-like n=1 Tax=Triticum urartu TaxID=4572 RepID=UPI00204343B7|nr:zyxin-like [Triticum urartu]